MKFAVPPVSGFNAAQTYGVPSNSALTLEVTKSTVSVDAILSVTQDDGLAGSLVCNSSL